MSIVKIETQGNKSLKEAKPLFETAKDLAHFHIKEWAETNHLLCAEVDLAMDLFCCTVGTQEKRNFIREYFFRKKLKQARKNLVLFVREIRSLVLEVEALIGFQTSFKEGKKSRIKNKKVFDDMITDRREIAIMLQGLLLLIETQQYKELDFKNELDIVRNLPGQNPLGDISDDGFYVRSKPCTYFRQLSACAVIFEFT